MKRLTLVNPSQGFSTGCIPLGLASISAYLKKYGGMKEIRLLDANCQDLYQNFIPPDIVGITSATQDIKHAIRFAEFVKSHGDIPVILGGVHISTYRILPAPFDVGVIGEGEETMLELMQLKDFTQETISSVKGICYNVGGKTFFTEPRPIISPLDRIPIPDRDFANLDYYLRKQQIIPYHSGRSLTMISSRGCPFNCVFCSTKVHWQKFRSFSAERVLEEIELLINKYGAEIIHIFDDLFIADKKRLIEIHNLIVKKGINKQVKFMCLVRSDMLDDQTMTLLKEMNVVVTGIGMESGCPRTLNYLKRRTTTVEKNRHAIELSNKYNIPTMGSFMVGNPGETEEELLQTLEFIKGYRHSPYLSPLSYIAAAFPGTEFWLYAKERNIPVENFDDIVMDIPDTIDKLKCSPLLTEIPMERFFAITQLFAKEGRYGALKKYIFLPDNWLSYVKAYCGGILIERNPIIGIIEVTRILFNFIKYKKMARQLFIPARGTVSFNRILDKEAREQYNHVVEQMFTYVPRMMKRKIPEANVQQAFVLDAVYSFASRVKSPKILCVGSYEDTAAASLKVMGNPVEEIDPSINYDLDTYLHLPTTTPGSFDVIFSTSVIEHVADDETFVSQIASLLKPGGVCVLTCDYNDAYILGDRLPQADLRFYTKKDLLERLVPCAIGCTLIDEPRWDNSMPDFTYDSCLYTFATLTFQKSIP